MKEKLHSLIKNILEHKVCYENLDQDYLQQLCLEIGKNYPIILVTGTNGKGSVCAYLSSILKLSGYKVGTFTSPHILDYNERIAVNGEEISDDALYKGLQEMIKFTNYYDHPLGLFRLLTLVAHSYFVKNKIDIAVCEVGIGGGRDITNCFEPDISIITCVALDHCEILGYTRSEIGLEKAKIFRPHKPAIYGEVAIPDTVLGYANQINANLLRFGTDFNIQINDRNSWHYLNLTDHGLNLYSLLTPSMRGIQQIINSAIAICAIQQLTIINNKFSFNKTAIKNALAITKLRGRFEVMPEYPRVIFDVAHNPNAVANMVQNMIELGIKNNIALFAAAKDKDIKNIIKNSKKYFEKWYIAPIDNVERSSDISEIKEELIKQKVNPDAIESFTSVADAMKAALKMRQANYNIVIFGSFLTVAEASKCKI